MTQTICFGTNIPKHRVWGGSPTSVLRPLGAAKIASVATLALLAVSALANIGTLYNKCVFMAMLRCEK